jgi:uncharacterized protein YodC (DUF2158 family)
MRQTKNAAAEQFRTGARVVLQSGGPLMVVLDVGKSTGHVWCRWMDRGEPREASFPAACLTDDPAKIRDALRLSLGGLAS